MQWKKAKNVFFCYLNQCDFVNIVHELWQFHLIKLSVWYDTISVEKTDRQIVRRPDKLSVYKCHIDSFIQLTLLWNCIYCMHFIISVCYLFHTHVFGNGKYNISSPDIDCLAVFVDFKPILHKKLARNFCTLEDFRIIVVMLMTNNIESIPFKELICEN